MMKKILISFLITLLILPLVLAINIDVNSQEKEVVMVPELNKPVILNLKITNNGPSDSFQFYNLLGFVMSPTEKISITSGETKEIQLKIYPREEFNYKGFYTFQYSIRGQDSTETKEEVMIKIIDLEDAFEIGSGEVDSESNSISIYIHNKENFDFGEISTKFSSAFFNMEEKFILGPSERKYFTIQLNKEDFKKLMAGFYTLNAEISVEDKKTKIEGVIKFVEKDIVKTKAEEYGLIINTKITEKINEGNVIANVEINMEKNIISRLFTTFSPEPDIVERNGLVVQYSWSKELKPGESLRVVVKTNWLFPFIVILLIVAIVILTKQYSKTNLVLRKRVSFVNAKGGEFALKVSILVNAKAYIEKVNIMDRLPPLVKLYHRFGPEAPSKIDEKTKRIQWNFEKLEAGETRILSYIIYSKVGVLGRFALPSTIGIYEKEGETHESESNKTFFVADQMKRTSEEQ